MAVLLTFFFVTTAFAGWLIFHKPAFRGKVIDAETKVPIEGAVVVAIYRTQSIIGSPAGGWTSIIKVKETMTDKSGEFSFPAYTKSTNPNAIDSDTAFIIYKSGYGKRITPPSGISRETLEHFFSADDFGKQGEVEIEIGDDRGSTQSVTYGVVELPKVQTKKERLRAILVLGTPGRLRSKQLPLLYKAINEKYRQLGVSEVK